MKKKIVKISLIFMGALALFFLLLNFFVYFSGRSRIYSQIENLPERKVILVLGASVHSDRTLSDAFRDRLEMAFEVYSSGKAQKILISGDNSKRSYNEPQSGKEYLLEKGVPEDDIFLDYAGFDTYDSLYRAREIFGLQSLIISTQRFHQYRSIYIAKNLGMDAIGIEADKRTYLKFAQNFFRERLAVIKAFLNITFETKPKFLGEKISID